MTTPRDFFESYVLRSYNALRQQPNDEYLAKIAVHHASVMAERRMWHYYATRDAARVFGANDAASYRRAIEQNECSDFGILQVAQFRRGRRSAE
jgi:hypothetical protein